MSRPTPIRVLDSGPGRWTLVRAVALAFLDEHGAEADRLGWHALELFGVHPVVTAASPEWAARPPPSS
jgi:hypothetical protein